VLAGPPAFTFSHNFTSLVQFCCSLQKHGCVLRRF
jgi:hypothetical protein